MDLGLSNRVAIVTAASRGLGRAAAEGPGEAGVKLVVNARSAQQLEQLADCIATDVIPVSGDLRDHEPADQLVGTALEIDRSADGRVLKITLARSGRSRSLYSPMLEVFALPIEQPSEAFSTPFCLEPDLGILAAPASATDTRTP